MIDKQSKEKVAARAFEIYEYRQANGIPGCALQDWLEAELDLCDRRQITGCPKCNFPLLTRKDDNITCLSNTCDWQVKAKRDTDSKIPTVQELKKDWNGG